MKSILVIEDNEFIRDIICRIIEGAGYTVTKAYDGEEGINTIENTSFDLVICDIRMPNKDGYEVLKFIKHFTNPPAFIFLTAQTDRQDWRKGMEMGADDFITKPFTREDVLNSVKAQLTKRENLLKRFNLEKEMIELLKDKIITDDQKEDDLKYEGNLFISDTDKSEFIKISSILYLEASGDYTKIYTSDYKTFTIRKPMKVWESKLPGEKFLRIHRSTIINSEYIEKVEKWNNYSHKLHLKGVNDFFIISQRYSRKLKKQISRM
jgi:DNA-binding LytR/AlgR family response regulator